MAHGFPSLLVITGGLLATPAFADWVGPERRWTNPILAAAYKGASRNDCESERRPSISFVDANRDGRREALVVDRSDCYHRVGSHFTLVAQVGNAWRRIGYWNGRARWLRTRSEGWLDFEVPDHLRGSRCFQVYRFRSGHYFHDYLAEKAPHQCRAWMGRQGEGSSLRPMPPRPR